MMPKLLNGHKKPKVKRVYRHVSDKTINIATSATMPRVQSVNPLFNLTVAKAFALSKKSNDKLGTPLKKQSNMMIILILAIVGIAAIAMVMVLGGGGGQAGEGGLAGPLGPISKLAESFNLPNLETSPRR